MVKLFDIELSGALMPTEINPLAVGVHVKVCELVEISTNVIFKHPGNETESAVFGRLFPVMTNGIGELNGPIIVFGVKLSIEGWLFVTGETTTD